MKKEKSLQKDVNEMRQKSRQQMNFDIRLRVKSQRISNLKPRSDNEKRTLSVFDLKSDIKYPKA